jgi:histidinol-phosphate aminotransferase
MSRPRPRDSVALMDGYHSPQIDVDVRLNTNESPVPPPLEFVDALVAEIARIDWHRYPTRAATELRTAIGELHEVGPERIFAANGSNEVLQTLLLTYGGPGRSAAIFEPTYALHSHLSRITGTTVAEGERAADFGLDIDEVARVLRAEMPAITFLCSPNNPTGVVDTPAQIEAVLELVIETGGLLCVDEAYGQFASHSAIDLLGPEVPLAVTRTYSKTWAMAAARLGYLIGPEWLVDDLEKVVLPYHLDAMTQIAGRQALAHLDAMNLRVATLIEERERLCRALADLPVEVWPSGANFVLFRPLSADGADVWRRLTERSVLVRDCSSWPRLAGCLRVTIGTADEDDRFVSALREILT